MSSIIVLVLSDLAEIEQFNLMIFYSESFRADVLINVSFIMNGFDCIEHLEG